MTTRVSADIASTIKAQIGTDNWLAVSARAPKFWTDDAGNVVFAFRFGSRHGLAKYVQITYRDRTDDYAIQAFKVRRNGLRETFKVVNDWGVEYTESDGIYADQIGWIVRYYNTIAEFA